MSPELWGVSKSPETLLEQGKLKYVVPTLRHDPINAIAERRYNVYVFSLLLFLFDIQLRRKPEVYNDFTCRS
jgi:hypothetical protein